MQRPVRALAVAVLAAAGGWTGCGGDRTGGPQGPPAVVVGAAPDKTLAAGTAQIVAIAGDATVEAAVNLATGAGRGLLKSPQVGRTGGVAVVLDYEQAYLGQAPAATADAAVAGSAPPELVGPGLQPGNPLAALDLLRGATEVEPYGGTSVRGTSTQRYSIGVSPERMASMAPPGRASAVARAAGGLGRAAVPAEVWIDSAGRVRRIQLGRDLQRRTTTTDGRGVFPVTTIDFFDFGAEVR